MPISENIKQLRERYGITQKELAEIAGVTDKAVSTWEIGTNEPRMGAIQKIADYFHIKKSDLIEDKGMQILKENPADRIDGGALDAIKSNDRKLKLVQWIAGLDDRGLDRIEKILDFVESLPK